jgi:hypothetical protein
MWRRINISAMLLAHGKGICPQDQSALETYRGESVPPTMTIKRCQRCGKWWFPSDTLFDYKPALEAKVNYFRLWGITSNVFNMVLPVMGVLLLVAGLSVGMVVIGQKSQLETKATVGVGMPSIMYLGNGEAEIAFISSEKIETLSFRKNTEEAWVQVPVKFNKGLYEAGLTGIREGENYALKIAGKEYLMRVE